MRLQLTRRTLLVARALQALDGQQRLTASTIAPLIGAAPSYVPQVMAPLVRAGWVSSGSGPHGGYDLTVDLGSLSLLDVIEAVEGPIHGATCAKPVGECTQEHPCLVHAPWTAAVAALAAELADAPLVAQPSLAPTTPGAAEMRPHSMQGDHT